MTILCHTQQYFEGEKTKVFSFITNQERQIWLTRQTVSMMHMDVWHLKAISTSNRTCIPLAGGAATFCGIGTGALSSGTGFLGTASSFLKKKFIVRDAKLITVYGHKPITKHKSETWQFFK